VLLAACAVGCGGEAASPDKGLTVEMNGQSLVLKVDSGTHLRYDTCDLFQGLDEQQGTKWVPVRDDLPVTYYGELSTFDGYMLDGEFVPPTTFAGCDNVYCDDLPDGTDVGDATEYVADGTTAPPASYDYKDRPVPPATVGVYESHPLHGVRLRTHVKYFTDMDCKTQHDVTLEVNAP
jgi:hypothetical protein